MPWMNSRTISIESLLDTHAFLSFMVDDSRLSATARKIFIDPDNNLYLSIASVWEMAIKSGLEKLKLPLPIDQYIASRTKNHDIVLLDLTVEHIAVVENLPYHHKDPFDRLLISQCISEKLPILSSDRMFSAYPVQIVW